MRFSANHATVWSWTTISLAMDQHLQTKYVFVDTEAFRRAQFHWKGKALSKLVKFAKEGHLHLLTTDITKREVRSHLQEWLIEATNAVKKHEIVLGQLGNTDITMTLSDSGAFRKLDAAFEHFLKATKAIDVPTAATLDGIFSDYFARRPPFSDKKKAEFPDAVVIASLRAWCAKQNAKAYVVSGDPDLKECCSTSGPLLHSPSIEDIVSQATVSKELHDALERVLFESEELSESLADQLRELIVVRGDARLRRLSGIVRDVDDISVHYVNVLEREGMTFTCEIEFEARFVLRIELEEKEQFGYEYEDYEPARLSRTEKSIHRVFTAEVVVKFDSEKSDEAELESVYVFKENIELDIDDVMRR